jgi:hypothetical protein
MCREFTVTPWPSVPPRLPFTRGNEAAKAMYEAHGVEILDGVEWCLESKSWFHTKAFGTTGFSRRPDAGYCAEKNTIFH